MIPSVLTMKYSEGETTDISVTQYVLENDLIPFNSQPLIDRSLIPFELHLLAKPC